MQQHDALLQKWLSEGGVHTYRAEFRRYKEKTYLCSTRTLWTDKALEVDAHVWLAATSAQPRLIDSSEHSSINLNLRKRNSIYLLHD